MKIQNDIKKLVIKNSIVTFGNTLVTVVAIIVCAYVIVKNSDESKNNAYMINSQGEVIPLQYMNRRDNIQVELKHHLNLFVDNFYSLNQNNWDEKAVNKAFFLGNVENLHTDRMNKGYYNRFIQYNVEQFAILKPENIEIKTLDSEDFEFKIIINLLEKYDTEKTNWIVFARGKARLTDRKFPSDLNPAYNPHGIWIYEYIEDRIEKMTE